MPDTRSTVPPKMAVPHAQVMQVTAEIVRAETVTFTPKLPRRKPADREYRKRGQVRTVEFY